MRVNFVEVWRVCNRRRHRYEQRELSQRFSSTVADKFDGVGAVSGHGAFPLITGCAFDRANVRFESFASILACPRHVRLGGNLGSAGCPVLPVPHHLLSNVRHDVAIAGIFKLLHGPPVT
jgi:hypothetical protein